MTEQTPLTAESQALLARVTSDWDIDPYGEYDRAKASLVADLRAIEAAAARRAIERVRAVASDLDSRGMGLAALSLLEAIESSAALPRPEEPRDERCAFVWKSGTPCGKPKRDSRHKHDSSCLTGGEGHITDMLCHPFTPEAR